MIDEHRHHHHHGHHHSHGHELGPELGHGPRSAFAIALVLNLGFVVAEFVWGLLADSMSLLADAAHNLGDAAGIGLTWFAATLASRSPTLQRTYGFRKATILSALANAILVVLTIGAVGWEAIERLSAPPPVHAPTVIIVAAVGVAVNGLSAMLFMRSTHDVNVRAAFVHLLADALVSIGVVMTGVVLLLTDWQWLDPCVSLGVSAIILWLTWSLLRDSLDLALDAVPSHIDANRVRSYLRNATGVRDVHDVHIWAMSSHEVALTAHMVVDDDEDRARLLHDIDTGLRERYGICHCTIQIEPPDAAHPHCGSQVA